MLNTGLHWHWKDITLWQGSHSLMNLPSTSWMGRERLLSLEQGGLRTGQLNRPPCLGASIEGRSTEKIRAMGARRLGVFQSRLVFSPPKKKVEQMSYRI